MSRKITMNRTENKTFEQVFSMFITSRTANGVSDATIRNYHQHLHSISKYLDIQMPFDGAKKVPKILKIGSDASIMILKLTVNTHLTV